MKKKEILFDIDSNGCHVCNSHCLNSKGYPMVTVKIGLKWRNFKISRYIYEKNYGSIPDGMFVCHKCDNRKCINPKHLFLGTAKDNYIDSKIKNRHSCGENHGHSKLTWEKVKNIRADNRKYREIAAEYGVSEPTINSIKNNYTWIVDNDFLDMRSRIKIRAMTGKRYTHNRKRILVTEPHPTNCEGK